MNRTACIVEWDGLELAYVIPRAVIPQVEETNRRSRENTARMLIGTLPHTLLALELREEFDEEFNC